MIRRPKLFGPGILAGVILAAGIVSSGGYLGSARQAAQAAAVDLARCRRMVEEIRAYRRLPARVADEEWLASQTTAMIEAAAAQAGLPPDSLVRISPEAPQRLGQSPYQEKPIQVALSNVSSRQLAGLLHGLSCQARSLSPKSIHLTSPRQESAAGAWSAQVVLTYLIYQPSKAQQPGAYP